MSSHHPQQAHSPNTHLLTEEQKHRSKTEHQSFVAEIEHTLSRPAQIQRRSTQTELTPW